MSRSDHEIEVIHKRSEAANEILDRLRAGAGSAASNDVKRTDEPSDTISERVTASYPGEEAGLDDAGNTGNTLE